MWISMPARTSDAGGPLVCTPVRRLASRRSIAETGESSVSGMRDQAVRVRAEAYCVLPRGTCGASGASDASSHSRHSSNERAQGGCLLPWLGHGSRVRNLREETVLRHAGLPLPPAFTSPVEPERAAHSRARRREAEARERLHELPEGRQGAAAAGQVVGRQLLGLILTPKSGSTGPIPSPIDSACRIASVTKRFPRRTASRSTSPRAR